jgi:hypothetical protein
VIEHGPVATRVMDDPETVQTEPGEAEYATVSPEDAVATSVGGLVPNI